jgi:small subunit ribosomal protein S14
MAKKSMLQREINRQKLITKYRLKRLELLLKFKKAITFEEKKLISFKIQKLPKNSSSTRLRNRCWKTGKPRGYYRFFGLCRNAIRELSLQCYLPGVIKSSW